MMGARVGALFFFPLFLWASWGWVTGESERPDEFFFGGREGGRGEGEEGNGVSEVSKVSTVTGGRSLVEVQSKGGKLGEEKKKKEKT